MTNHKKDRCIFSSGLYLCLLSAFSLYDDTNVSTTKNIVLFGYRRVW